MRIQNIRTQREKVELLRERIARLRSAMETGSRQLFTERLGPQDYRDKLAEDMARLDELERMLVDEVVSLESGIRMAERALEELPEQQRVILRLRYMEGLSWRTVAKHAHYSESHCKKIHKKAMEKMAASPPG